MSNEHLVGRVVGMWRYPVKSMGAEALVDEDNDKPTVVALREIAEELITNENVDTIGKPAVADEFAESGHIEFPLPE